MISGQKVRGTIKGFVDGGLEVKVGANLVGFIPTLFLSDVRLQHPEKKFFIGNKQDLGNLRPSSNMVGSTQNFIFMIRVYWNRVFDVRVGWG